MHKLSLIVPMLLSSGVTNISYADDTEDGRKNVNFSSVIEVEAGYVDSDEWGDDNSSSDVALATAEFGIELTVVKNVSINMVTLYKEGDVDFGIHTGFLQLDNLGGNNLSMSFGKMYLPFGQLETNLVNDTLALELVSPEQSIGFRETTIRFNWVVGNINLDGYVFNGDIDGEDELSDWGISFGYDSEEFTFGADYLNNVASSAMITEALFEQGVMTPNDKLNAISVNALVQLGAAILLFEHIQTASLDKIGFQTTHEPSVSQIDLGYDLGNGWTIATAYQMTHEARVLGMPESRITAGMGTSFYNETISLSFEYWHDEDYNSSDGGSGEASNGIVLQIASEF